MDGRLKKFVQLIDAGSFTKASRELHISQPALSVAVAKLERELGAPLLMHGVRPLTLTPAGQLAYAAGKEMMVKTNNLRVLLAELEHCDLAVSVGMIDSVAGLLFASSESVDELERQASVSLVVDNSRNLLQAVEKGTLDVVFVAAQPHYGGVLEVTHRAVEPLVAVCHVELAGAVNKAVQIGRLPRFISYDQASTTHRLIGDALQQLGATPEPLFYSTSPEVMLRLVLLGKGVAVLPYLLVREQLAAGVLAMVGTPAPIVIERPIRAVKRRDAVLPKPLVRTARQLGRLLDDMQVEVRALGPGKR